MIRVVVIQRRDAPNFLGRPMLVGESAVLFRGNFFDNETRTILSGDQWVLLQTLRNVRGTSRPIFPFNGYRALTVGFQDDPEGVEGSAADQIDPWQSLLEPAFFQLLCRGRHRTNPHRPPMWRYEWL